LVSAQHQVARLHDSLAGLGELGERPTIERVRQQLGRGSPNTVGPMLDGWYGSLAKRLQSPVDAVEQQRMQSVSARRQRKLITGANARAWKSVLRLRNADSMQRWIGRAKNRSGLRSNWRATPGNLPRPCRLRWRKLGSWRPM